MLVVIDTNVLVSALWAKNSNPAKVLSLVQNGLLTPCYDYRIMQEYREVLLRPKFGFSEWEVTDLLAQIENDGLTVTATPLDIYFQDEDDKKFFEVAKQCNAFLVTGNLKHFPDDSLVLSAAELIGKVIGSGM